MATPAQALRTLTDDFARSVSLVDSIRDLRFPAGSARRFPALPYFQTALIAELAFLRCFLSWEVFLEETFMAYVQGARSPSGASYTSYVSSPKLEHTRKIVRGEKRSFVSWADSNAVLARAKLYLRDGEPFETALSTISTPLSDMVIVRNRIAHRSGPAAERFLELVRRRHGFVQRGMSPGRYLLGRGTNPAQRQLDEYLGLLNTAAASIAP